ncbi:hypothetical protein [Spirillospora sp. NPDC047279]|uniref:hypothetical protein n=1 Tax=Spirillospora sp. NPDC047279 TaxID=3155478 RepID=UPI0033DB9BC5
MADNIRLHVSGTPDQARVLIEQVLQADGFRFTWEQPGKALIEKGSRGKALLLGVFALHYRYNLMMYPQEGSVVIDIGLGGTGLHGGAAGAIKIRSKLDDIQHRLSAAFHSAGALIT